MMKLILNNIMIKGTVFNEQIDHTRDIKGDLLAEDDLN